VWINCSSVRATDTERGWSRKGGGHANSNNNDDSNSNKRINKTHGVISNQLNRKGNISVFVVDCALSFI